MVKHPYTYRLTVQRNLIGPNFEIGKGAIITLNLASKSLIRFLREVYHRDNFALQMSPASHTFLMTTNGCDFADSSIPCFTVPDPIHFAPDIVISGSNEE